MAKRNPRAPKKSAPPKKRPKKGAKPGKDTINQDKIEEEYGLSYALFQAFPELNKLLKEAVKANWTAAKFQVELRQSDWFKKHSDVWRENTALKYADPATYEERINNARTSVQNLMGTYGITLSEEALSRLTERTLLFGMSNDEIQDALAQYVVPSAAGHYGGELAGIENQLRNTAMANGVRIEDGQLQGWMQAITRGDASHDQYETFLRDTAASTFQLYGDQIKGGMNLSDVASPYVQSMAGLLELNPGSIDLFDPTIRKALAGTTNKEGKLVSTSIADFEDSLRQDSRWQFTRSAKDQAQGYIASLSKMWGLR